MGSYREQDRDFIKRTLRIIDQYAEFSEERGQDESFEVTLLMNCLLGLLIYPQQTAHIKRWDGWLTDAYLKDVGKEWGIEIDEIQHPGYYVSERSKILYSREQFTVRNLIRQIRNTSTHANFRIEGTDGRISHIVFKQKASEGFHLEIPVENLEKFVRSLAKAALDFIESEERKKASAR